jgi:hypothetical protein
MLVLGIHLDIGIVLVDNVSNTEGGLIECLLYIKQCDIS